MFSCLFVSSFSVSAIKSSQSFVLGRGGSLHSPGSVIVFGTLFFGLILNWIRGKHAFTLFDGYLAAFVWLVLNREPGKAVP